MASASGRIGARGARIDCGDDARLDGPAGGGADQYLALRGPAQHRQAAVLEGDALGHAAVERHHVGFDRAFIGGREGDPFAVEGERGVRFGGGMGGQALGLPAVDAALPQVALGRKDDRVGADRGEAETWVGGEGVAGGQASGRAKGAGSDAVSWWAIVDGKKKLVCHKKLPKSH